MEYFKYKCRWNSYTNEVIDNFVQKLSHKPCKKGNSHYLRPGTISIDKDEGPMCTWKVPYLSSDEYIASCCIIDE